MLRLLLLLLLLMSALQRTVIIVYCYDRLPVSNAVVVNEVERQAEAPSAKFVNSA